MQLTPHFSLAELTATNTGLPNTPGQDVIVHLRNLAEGLERVRPVLGGKPMLVSSGYRSPAVNKAVRGAQPDPARGKRGSCHLYGDAADFKCPAFGTPLQVARAIHAAGIRYDQLIHEYGRWVHISFGARMRGQALTIDRLGTRAGLLPAR